MVEMQGRVYVPALRTRDSELKGYENLEGEIKDLLLPVFELTKSRRTKTNPEGAISKTVDRLVSMLDGRPFIADVTSLESQGNAETESLLDPTGAFKNWREFVRNLPRSCIPVVHLSDPFDRDEVVSQINDLWTHSSAIALRVPTDYAYALELSQTLLPAASRGGAVILIADDGFVPQRDADHSAARCHEVFSHFAGKVDVAVTLASSFPSSVMLPAFGGGDAYGEFRLEEVLVSQAVKAIGLGSATVLHGDYGLIHPHDFDGVVTNWVPRIDVPLSFDGYYHRYRREAGGYGLAARLAVQNNRYVKLRCWADDCINEAASGNPPGRSPAFWIAARVNYHITRQALRLASDALL
ncbi:hypothetical protein [uncultured Stenotrophomonas sp.]|uniref:beta family protein n=1 Tax=uncultured Stenotrophomonas sp. TaxID=165438 RepID=UPI0028EDAB20|nr:hypothetical protein [uncultured Stenotrophomonas sp.]